MQITIDNVLWAGCMSSFGGVVFFLKRLVDKVDKSITKEDLISLAKRIDVLQELTYTLNAKVSIEIAAMRTELKWMQKDSHRSSKH